MTQTEYEKKLKKAKEYRERAIAKQLERISSPEYKEKQRTKYLITIQKNASKPRTSIKSKQKTAKKTKGEYFSILTSDMTRCYITGDRYNVVPHHIFGASKKAFSEKYGFILPLRSDWHTGTEYCIHKDTDMSVKYKRKCQEYWIDTLGKTKEEWIDECGKWY
jgi:hypothetical protein